MATETFANFPATTVPAGADGSSGTETWVVSSSDGFPTAATGVTQFHVADTNQAASSELVLVTNMSGTDNNTWTVTRGAEGTDPVTHQPGFTITAVITAGWLNAVSGTSLPAASAGALLYGTPAAAADWLGGNTTGTKEFLTSTGSSGTANTPVWGTISVSDVPVLNQNTTGTAANVTGVVAVANGGTGGTAVTAYAVVTGGTAPTTSLQTVSGLGAAGQALTSNGTAALPSWQNAPVDWLNVVAGYGATGNGKRSFHGAMTASSNVLSISTDTLFTAGDVGKLVMVDGAGGTNIPLSGTITGCTNSSTVTLSVTASATVSSETVYWGTDDTAAIQAAITAAKVTGSNDSLALLGTVQAVFLPNGIYMISSALVPQQSKSFALTGNQASIVGASSAIIDFQAASHLLEGTVMIDGIWFEGCGGHVFQNANIHGEVTIQRCNFVARNVGYGIWYQDDVVNSTSTSLYKATFRDITYWQGSGTRSVELWHFLTALGADLTDITFENVNGPNPTGAGPTPLDDTQYQFLLSSNDTAAITNLAWRNCLSASCYGGYIKAQGARNVVIDGIDFYNTYSVAVTNDLISIGKNAQNTASKFVSIRNVTRNNALGNASPPPPYDITFDATSFEVEVSNCSGQSPFCINLNACSGAVIRTSKTTVNTAATIANYGGDTIVIDGGNVTIGNQSIAPSSLASVNGLKAYTHELAASSSTGNLAINGTLYLQKFPVSVQASYSKVLWFNTVAGAGAVTGENYAGIYTVSGTTATLLASGSADSLVTVPNNVATCTMGTAVTLAPGSYYAGLLFNAGTAPTVARASAGAGLYNMNVSGAALRCATGGTGLTVLPGTVITISSSNTFPWTVGLA